MIPLFNDSDNLKTATFNRLKVISAYSKIQDVTLQNAFKEYVSEVLSRLSSSNSSEIFIFRK